jgi:hypothetical protein
VDVSVDLRDWAARKRRIGQRGSQTEMMRGMVKLHYPLAWSSVAAALELELPAPARDEAEAIARGCGCGDAPARHCNACHAGRTQQQKEASGFSGRDMQSLAGSEIELSDHARDGGRHARAQRLFHRPERLGGVWGRDQNHAGGIKTKAVETMAIRPAKGGEPAGRGDERERRAWTDPAQHCRHDRGCRNRWPPARPRAGRLARPPSAGWPSMPAGRGQRQRTGGDALLYQQAA